MGSRHANESIYPQCKVCGGTMYALKYPPGIDKILCHDCGDIVILESLQKRTVQPIVRKYKAHSPTWEQVYMTPSERQELQNLKQKMDLKKATTAKPRPVPEVIPFGQIKPATGIHDSLDEFPEETRRVLRQRKTAIGYEVT